MQAAYLYDEAGAAFSTRWRSICRKYLIFMHSGLKGRRINAIYLIAGCAHSYWASGIFGTQKRIKTTPKRLETAKTAPGALDLAVL
ncbi:MULTISPECIES: hypothetical protein [Polaromonas]|uniref:Uncharacterized protein n=1 Tax=Polaromonas aquatica TaxID=332657 RepID=A0ABW1TQY9_9BURK